MPNVTNQNEFLKTQVQVHLYLLRKRYFLTIAKAKRDVRRMLRESKERVENAAIILAGISSPNIQKLEYKRSGYIISLD